MYKLKIKGIRQSRGMSINELSNLAGVPKSIISKLENDTGNPTLATVNKLAKVLGPGTLVWRDGK